MGRILQVERLETRAMLDGAAGEDGPYVTIQATEPLPDFHLTDVNPASPRSNQAVSPRDYVDQVSAWYFIHST